jgi:hypothetical protein
MLILNEELWKDDNILKFYCSDNWDKDDTFVMTQCALDRLKQILIESYYNDKEGVLIFDCNKGIFPSMQQALQIASFMVSIKEQIEGGLSYTIVYAKSKENRDWVNNILKLYVPVKPVYVVSSKEEVKNLLIKQVTEAN